MASDGFFVTGMSQALAATVPAKPDVSIVNFDEDLSDSEIPHFTDPATISAMRRLGFVPSDLCRVTDGSVSDFPRLRSVRAQAKAVLNARRARRIADISAVRASLLAASTAARRSPATDPVALLTNQFEAGLRAREEREARQIAALQRREAEALIIAESSGGSTRQKRANAPKRWRSGGGRRRPRSGARRRWRRSGGRPSRRGSGRWTKRLTGLRDSFGEFDD
jgi:hypothetical protein